MEANDAARTGKQVSHFEEIARLLPEVKCKVVSEHLCELVTDGMTSQIANSDDRQRMR